MSADPEIVVVGAGVAGLAAAARIRAAGRSCLVLEAGARIGGRAFTTTPPALGGAAFDHGASWLHNAERNPLAPFARAAGIGLAEAFASRTYLTRIGDRWATPAERAACERAEARFTAAMRARAAAGPDASLLEASRTLPPDPDTDPWIATVLTWESAVVAAAEAATLSLRDWADNLLDGTNLAVAGGVGAMVAAVLGPPAGKVAFNTPVRRITREDGVRVRTDDGDIRAAAAIVTVSTGVLASGAIGFAPALPPATAAAIAGLPMGLLTKLAFPATPGERLGIPESVVDRQVRQAGDPMPVVQMWPGGRDMVTVFLNGAMAWEAARGGPRAGEALARDWLRGLFGSAIERVLGPACVVTDWAGDPRFRGAYAYAPPGLAGARAALAEPVWDGRMAFAGEACHCGQAGTVAGAFLSGQAAAERMLAHLPPG